MPKSKSKRRKVIQQEKRERSGVPAAAKAPVEPRWAPSPAQMSARLEMASPFLSGNLGALGGRPSAEPRWEDWVSDMYGFGDPCFPSDTLMSLHADGYTLADVSETFRQWWLKIANDCAETSRDDGERASFQADADRLSAVVTGGRTIPREHDGYSLIYQTMEDCFGEDQAKFVVALADAAKRGVTLDVVAGAAADVEDFF
jgi:hypothetical protein